MDIRRLELLLALSRLGSMRAVADAHHLTNSTVSQQIAALARETGAQLIEPEGRRVRLTPAGLRLADHAVTILAAVASSTMTDPQWQNSTVLSGDPVEQVRQLKSQPGKDIVLTGSISLGHALVAAGLVDEYRLSINPAVQGRGRRLFPDGYTAAGLRLIEPPKSFKGDVTLLKYAGFATG